MEWDLAMKVRGQALHLVSHSEGQTMLVERRQQAIEHHYAQFDTVISKVEKQLQSRIDSISAVAEQANTTSANKVILRKWCNNRLMPQKVAIKEARQAFDQFQQNMLDKPLQTSRMLVEMKDGKPVKCYALPDA